MFRLRNISRSRSACPERSRGDPYKLIRRMSGGVPHSISSRDRGLHQQFVGPLHDRMLHLLQIVLYEI